MYTTKYSESWKVNSPEPLFLMSEEVSARYPYMSSHGTALRITASGRDVMNSHARFVPGSLSEDAWNNFPEYESAFMNRFDLIAGSHPGTYQFSTYAGLTFPEMGIADYISVVSGSISERVTISFACSIASIDTATTVYVVTESAAAIRATAAWSKIKERFKNMVLIDPRNFALPALA